MDNPLHGMAAGIIRQKLRAYETLATEVTRIESAQAELEKALLAQAPEDLRAFLEEGWLTQTLTHGVTSGKTELEELGCKDYKEAMEKLMRLRKAWKGVISIKLPTKKEWEDAGYLRLVFSAI